MVRLERNYNVYEYPILFQLHVTYTRLLSENNQLLMIRRVFIFKKQPTLDDETFVYFLKTTNPR